MAIAVNIRADNETAKAVEQVWDEVAAIVGQPSLRALEYPPHFTFAIYDAPEVDEKIACAAMLSVAAGRAPLPIAFKRMRWFAGPSLILWLEPEASGPLAQWHAAISAAIDLAHCRPNYRPGAWTPHCSVGLWVPEDKRDDAMAFAQSFDRKIEVVFDVADCATFPPVKVLAQHKLRFR